MGKKHSASSARAHFSWKAKHIPCLVGDFGDGKTVLASLNFNLKTHKQHDPGFKN